MVIYFGEDLWMRAFERTESSYPQLLNHGGVKRAAEEAKGEEPRV
jgi:hypothetical protein